MVCPSFCCLCFFFLLLLSFPNLECLWKITFLGEYCPPLHFINLPPVFFTVSKRLTWWGSLGGMSLLIMSPVVTYL